MAISRLDQGSDRGQDRDQTTAGDKSLAGPDDFQRACPAVAPLLNRFVEAEILPRLALARTARRRLATTGTETAR